MSTPRPGDRVSHKYRLLSVLGHGEASTVFAAEDVITREPVAIKWVEPPLRDAVEVSLRLRCEAQALRVIAHPSVLKVFEFGQVGAASFLVMELEHGHALADELEQGLQEPSEFVALMLPVLRGVQAAHDAGVIHRDLKPENIRVCIDPRSGARSLKVHNFGSSKFANNAGNLDGELTHVSALFGTPQFMAPEQMRDARSADERSDIYALGAIFCHAISGAYPSDGATLRELAIRVVEGETLLLHERAPAVERGLSRAIMRALAVDPALRFESVHDFAEALNPWKAGPLLADRALPRSLDVRDERHVAMPAAVSPPTHARSGPFIDARATGHDQPKLVPPPLPVSIIQPLDTAVRRSPKPMRPQVRALFALSILALGFCVGWLALHVFIVP